MHFKSTALLAVLCLSCSTHAFVPATRTCASGIAAPFHATTLEETVLDKPAEELGVQDQAKVAEKTVVVLEDDIAEALQAEAEAMAPLAKGSHSRPS